MSTVLVKLQKKGQMVIPRNLRDEVGISEGTLLKVSVIEGGQFLVTPQLTIDPPGAAGRQSKSGKQALDELSQVLAELRQEAKEKGLDKMPRSEIDAAVTAARQELKNKIKQPKK